jgi:coenzyme PQQ synthesis protein D (PqqD)
MDKADQVHYVNAEGLDVHEADDGLVVFKAATDSVHHLNHTAGVIFELCRNTVSLQQLIKLVSELYGQTEEATAEAVEAGLNQLVEEGVVIEQHDN